MDKKEKHENKTRYIYISAAALLFLILIIYFSYLFIFVRGLQTIEISHRMKGTSLNLSTINNTRLGISADRDFLFFGRVPQTSNITKILEINNPSHYKAYAKYKLEGNISRFIIVGDKNKKDIILIPPNSTKKVHVKFTAKDPGNYTGTISLKIYVPKNYILEKYYQWVYE